MITEEKKKKYLSDLGLLFVAAVWGGGFVAVKDALNTVTPMFLMAMRFTLASAVLYLFLHRKIGKLSKDDLKKGSIVGIFLFLAFAFQTYGLQFTTASKQGFITATYVVIVPFLYWLFYKQSPKLKSFIGSFLTIIGISFISLESDLLINIGDLLTLVCAFFFAAHILSIEYFTKNMNVFKLAFVQIFSAAIFFIIIAFLSEPIPTALTTRAWVAIIYMSVFSTFACFTVQTIAQKNTPSSHASIILSLESVFAAVFGILLLNEVMNTMILLGCLLIFIAILIVEVDLEIVNTFKRKLLSVKTNDKKSY